LPNSCKESKNEGKNKPVADSRILVPATVSEGAGCRHPTFPPPRTAEIEPPQLHQHASKETTQNAHLINQSKSGQPGSAGLQGAAAGSDHRPFSNFRPPSSHDDCP